MNKLLAALLFTLLLTCHLHAQILIDREDEHFFGSVRTVRIEGFDWSPKEGKFLEKVPSRVQTITYDRQGNITERTLYKADGSVEHQVNYTYDSKGRRMSWKEYYGTSTGILPGGYTKHAVFKYGTNEKIAEVSVYREKSIVHKTLIAYDEKGNKIRESNSGSDALALNRAYKYDLKGNLIEESQDGNGFSHKSIRSYDDARNIIEESQYDNGSLIIKAIRSYNDTGKLISVTTFNQIGSMNGKTLNGYDAKGNLVESVSDGEHMSSRTTVSYENGRIKTKETFTSYKNGYVESDHDPKPGKEIIIYNDAGQEIEHSYYDKGEVLRYKLASTYNAQGKLIETVTYKSDGKPEFKQMIEYDVNGNQIKKSLETFTKTGTLEVSVAERRSYTYWINQ